MARALYILVLLGLSLPALARDNRGANQVKSDTLRALQEMRAVNIKRLQDIDETIRARIEDSTAANIENEIGRLKVAKREHALRQEFLDRLIFQVDTKFVGGDLRQFLERALTEMSKTDALSPTQADLWKFLKFAAEAVRRLPEQRENIITYLEGYMNRSVANPIRPEDYLNSRNYSNGSTSESGRPSTPEEAGDFAEIRLQEMDEVKTPPAPPVLAPVVVPVAQPAAPAPTITLPEVVPAPTAEPKPTMAIAPPENPAPEAAPANP